MNKKNIFIGFAAFFIVLFTMPLGHALMILMEHMLHGSALFYASFAIGTAGLVLTVSGVFVKGDTRQTLFGLFGGLFYWTGWVEFVYVYYANRFGVQPLLDSAGEIITKPEYLILPSSFGFFAMFLLLYLFSIKSGCSFFTYLQKIFFRKSKVRLEIRPITRHTALVTFMELNLILWTSYLVLLFCYDDHFIGDRHPVTALIAFACLAGSLYMFKKLLRIGHWGYAIRYSIATVIVFWTFVEVMGRWDVLHEIWVHPLEYKIEMITMLTALIVLLAVLMYNSLKKEKSRTAGRKDKKKEVANKRDL